MALWHPAPGRWGWSCRLAQPAQQGGYRADRRAVPGEEKEWLIIYSKEVLGKEYFDYFIFGHRHLPIDYPLGNIRRSRYINLGDWIRYNTYAVFDGDRLSLLTDTPEMADKIIRQ